MSMKCKQMSIQFKELVCISLLPGTWSHLWFEWFRECPPWCSIVSATVTVHQIFCILHITYVLLKTMSYLNIYIANLYRCYITEIHGNTHLVNLIPFYIQIIINTHMHTHNIDFKYTLCIHKNRYLAKWISWWLRKIRPAWVLTLSRPRIFHFVIFACSVFEAAWMLSYEWNQALHSSELIGVSQP